ncbi:ATP-binding protein [Actinoplanes sp. NPDC004185]
MELGAGVLTQDAADALAAVTARAALAPTAMIHVADGDQLRLAGGVGLPPGWAASRRVPVSSTLAGAVFTGHCPLIVEDVNADDRVPAEAPVRAVGIRSYAGFPILDFDGTVVGVCAVMDTRPRPWLPSERSGVDEGARACTAFIGERRAAATADRSRRFLDALLASLQVGVAAVDADGRIVVTNQAMRALSAGLAEAGDLRAWAEQQPLGDAAGRPLPPDTVPLLRALHGERLRDVEIRVERPGRQTRTLLTDAQPILGRHEEVLGAVAAVYDVTERRRAERFHDCELAVSRILSEPGSVQQIAERVLRAITETLDWPRAELWSVDDEAQVLRPTAVHSADYDTSMRAPAQLRCGQGLAGRAWKDGEPVFISNISADTDAMSARIPTGSGLRTALAVPVPSGEQTLAVLALFADVVEGRQELLVTLLKGIAALIGQFLERRRAQELQLALAFTKDEYLALIGHEMRTPLTSIAAYADQLLDLHAEDFDVEGRAMVTVVLRNSNQLRRIVDDLMDLSALDNGYATLLYQSCDLAALIREAAAGVQGHADQAGLSIACELPERCLISADAARLRQALDVLLSNAVLHTAPEGRITIVLTEIAGAVELTVTDTGVGIPVHEQPKVFGRFYRSSRTREQRIPGAGLGLALSRAIIERHKGTIRLLAEDQPGTSVQMRLPTARS